MLARCILSTVALRRGDLLLAARHLAGITTPGAAGQPPDPPTPYVRGCVEWVAAQVAEARDGPGGAMGVLAGVYAGVAEQRWVLVGEPTAASWLVRVALAVGDEPAAVDVVKAAESLHHDNPDFLSLAAAASHARGLLDRDAGALAFAAERAAGPRARACAAEDLGVLLAAQGRHDDAVRSLDLALGGHRATGSPRDEARVRRRLRDMGVRHRHWTYADRPVTGWESLTDTECTVSLLVAQGWTNQKVADQMFISVHTVAFHLRHVFRKLGIGSRVELARLAAEQGHSLAVTPPPKP